MPWLPSMGMDVTDSTFQISGHRALAHRARGRRLLGRVVRPVPPARAGDRARRRRARRQGRAGEGRRRREPDGRADLPDPEHPGGEGVPRRRGRLRVRRRPAAGGGRAVPRLAPALGGRRAGRQGRRAVAAAGAGARAAPRRRGRAARADPARTRRAATRRSSCVEQVPGSFAADGLAARIELESAPQGDGAPDLQEAFAALDAGDEERALDLLLGALPSADGSKDDIRRVVVGILDELGVEHPLARESRRRLATALY